MNDLYHQFLNQIQSTGNYRRLPQHRQGGIDFTSNDYLNLSRHPDVIQSAHQAALRYGIGATGSRLLSGNYDLMDGLEHQISVSKKTESALVFATGYQANTSVLSTLLSPAKVMVFFDKFNHASLYQAVQNTPCQLIRYRSCDMNHLEYLLTKYAANPAPKWIVTETVFGMDGTMAPLTQIANLSEKYGAWLYLDEAHATGLYGPHGYGLSTTLELPAQTIIMGTFSKAIGASGAYITCSALIKDYLVNLAGGFIYSTAPSPMIMGGVLKAWDLVRNMGPQRQYLLELSNYARSKLDGFNIMGHGSNIIPIGIGDPAQVIAIRDHLASKNIHVSAIRPPTVPPNTDRIRLALNVNHTRKDIDLLIQEFPR